MENSWVACSVSWLKTDCPDARAPVGAPPASPPAAGDLDTPGGWRGRGLAVVASDPSSLRSEGLRVRGLMRLDRLSGWELFRSVERGSCFYSAR